MIDWLPINGSNRVEETVIGGEKGRKWAEQGLGKRLVNNPHQNPEPWKRFVDESSATAERRLLMGK